MGRRRQLKLNEPWFDKDCQEIKKNISKNGKLQRPSKQPDKRRDLCAQETVGKIDKDQQIQP